MKEVENFFCKMYKLDHIGSVNEAQVILICSRGKKSQRHRHLRRWNGKEGKHELILKSKDPINPISNSLQNVMWT